MDGDSRKGEDGYPRAPSHEESRLRKKAERRLAELQAELERLKRGPKPKGSSSH